MAETKKKVLFLQDDLNPHGGQNAVAVWILEALKRLYDITILSWVPCDFNRINDYYGTSLCQEDYKCRFPPFFIRHIIDRIPIDRWHFLRLVIMMRWVKIINHQYDILIFANNEIDFGCRGIQYVHYPYQKVNWVKEPIHYREMGGYQYVLSIMHKHLRPWRKISGFSFERMLQNITLVNSNWSNNHWREVYGTDSVTVYPPVPGSFPDVPWGERENGFVCVGRLSSEKKYTNLIDILAAVRSHYPDIHLHIIGSSVNYDRKAYRKVRRKVKANASWVFLNENLSRKQLVNMVSRHRYGIHGMLDEHFGIAVAELIKAGCITFVPDSGGQVEIVGKNPNLLYQTDEEAVGKICHVLNHEHIQAELFEYIKNRKEMFTTEIFMQKIRDIVNEHVVNTKKRSW